MVFLHGLHFDNHFATLGPEFFTRLPPTPLPDPHLIAANHDVGAPPDLHLATLLVQPVSCTS